MRTRYFISGSASFFLLIIFGPCGHFLAPSVLIVSIMTFIETILQRRISDPVTAQKMKFSIKSFLSKCDQVTVDLVSFTEEVLHGKRHFLFNLLYIYNVIFCENT